MLVQMYVKVYVEVTNKSFGTVLPLHENAKLQYILEIFQAKRPPNLSEFDNTQVQTYNTIFFTWGFGNRSRNINNIVIIFFVLFYSAYSSKSLIL